MMPHDASGDPQPPMDDLGCPPNCPRRKWREELFASAAAKQVQDWDPTSPADVFERLANTEPVWVAICPDCEPKQTRPFRTQVVRDAWVDAHVDQFPDHEVIKGIETKALLPPGVSSTPIPSRTGKAVRVTFRGVLPDGQAIVDINRAAMEENLKRSTGLATIEDLMVVAENLEALKDLPGTATYPGDELIRQGMTEGPIDPLRDGRTFHLKASGSFESEPEAYTLRFHGTALTWRVGRRVGRTIYLQIGPEPSDEDQLIGVMDTPELAMQAVNAVNAQWRGHAEAKER